MNKIWFFRQAGRSLPEYNNYFKNNKCKDVLSQMIDPKVICDVSLLPYYKYI